MHFTHPSPPSFFARGVAAMLRWTNRKETYFDEFASGHFDAHDVPEAPRHVTRRFDVTRRHVSGRAFHTVAPRGTTSRGTIFFVHGGGFVHRMSRAHWRLVHELVDASDWSVVVTDYSVAPAHTVDDAYYVLSTSYDEVVRTRGPRRIVVVGDGAGGGLALGLTQKIAGRGAPLPSRLILLSPWLDASLGNHAIADLEDVDPVLQTAGLALAARAFAGSNALASPSMSPIHGPLGGLPPIDLFVGTHEIFYPDCRKLESMAEAASVPIHFFEYPEMFHDWVVRTQLPEAKSAIATISALLADIH